MKKLILLSALMNIVCMVQSQSWNLTGNSGTNPAINFLGTTDNNPLKFRVANVYAGEIDSVTGKTFFGYGTGKSTTGIRNLGIGFKALYSNTVAWDNTAMGYMALFSNVGYANTATGSMALYSNTTGYGNVASGLQSLYYNTGGSFNVGTGFYSLYNNTTGTDNTATGTYALTNNTSGYGNTGTGKKALSGNTTGQYNTANGFECLQTNQTGSDNTAMGNRALYTNLTGSNNIALGTFALYYNYSGVGNTAGGYRSMFYNTTGWNNSANGYYSLWQNTTGSYNSAQGYYSLASNTTSSYNTAVGSFSLFATTTSMFNTAIGYNAGGNYNMGWNNTMLGAHANTNNSDLYNCIAIGQSAATTASNQARIGNSSTNSIGGYANWSNISDGRFKKNVQQNVKGLEFIMKLQPVTYHLDVSGISKKLNENKDMQKHEATNKAIADKEKVLFSGFVAQDVEKAAEETGYDFSGVDKPKNEKDFYGLRYAEFVVPLVKAMQEQQQMINELIKQNADLQKRVQDLEKNPDAAYTPSGISKEILSAWPNPSNDIVFIQIASEIESLAVVKVFDNRGGLVREQRMSVIPGSNQLSIDMKGLASGTYHFSAEWNNGKMKRTVQVIKQ